MGARRAPARTLLDGGSGAYLLVSIGDVPAMAGLRRTGSRPWPRIPPRTAARPPARIPDRASSAWASASCLGGGGVAEDRGIGDLADRSIAQVLVEELADAAADFRAAEVAVAGVDDLDEDARDADGLERPGQPLGLVERDERIFVPVEDQERRVIAGDIRDRRGRSRLLLVFRQGAADQA